MQKKLWRRELFIVKHGQSVRFRIVKYMILIPLGVGLYVWTDGMTLLWTLLVLFIISLIIHFLFRFKTKGWTESWGPYKKIELPKDLE